MDFTIPADIAAYIAELDEFIEREIRPLEQQDDNIRFFDHRREHARTDWDNDGQPRHEWEELLAEMKRRADKAGHLRFGLPKALGGKDGSNLAMALIREHLAPWITALTESAGNETGKPEPVSYARAKSKSLKPNRAKASGKAARSACVCERTAARAWARRSLRRFKTSV